MTSPLSQEQRVELVAKAKAELADNMHALAWKFLDYRLAPHDDFYHFAAVDSWRTAERYRIILDALSALTVERNAALERVKALEAGPSREDVARIIEPHFDLSFDPDRGGVQNEIDRVANAALAKADDILALLTPKDPG